MPRYVRLRDPDGSFYDPEDRFHVVRHGIAPLPERICRRTEQALKKGILVDATCRDGSDATPSDPATTEPDRGDSQGQAVAETDTGAADSVAEEPRAVEKAAPATGNRRATKKK
jgi:hypothetical protein